MQGYEGSEVLEKFLPQQAVDASLLGLAPKTRSPMDLERRRSSQREQRRASIRSREGGSSTGTLEADDAGRAELLGGAEASPSSGRDTAESNPFPRAAPFTSSAPSGRLAGAGEARPMSERRQASLPIKVHMHSRPFAPPPRHQTAPLSMRGTRAGVSAATSKENDGSRGLAGTPTRDDEVAERLAMGLAARGQGAGAQQSADAASPTKPPSAKTSPTKVAPTKEQLQQFDALNELINSDIGAEARASADKLTARPPPVARGGSNISMQDLLVSPTTHRQRGAGSSRMRRSMEEVSTDIVDDAEEDEEEEEEGDDDDGEGSVYSEEEGSGVSETTSTGLRASLAAAHDELLLDAQSYRHLAQRAGPRKAGVGRAWRASVAGSSTVVGSAAGAGGSRRYDSGTGAGDTPARWGSGGGGGNRVSMMSAGEQEAVRELPFLHMSAPPLKREGSGGRVRGDRREAKPSSSGAASLAESARLWAGSEAGEAGDSRLRSSSFPHPPPPAGAGKGGGSRRMYGAAGPVPPPYSPASGGGHSSPAVPVDSSGWNAGAARRPQPLAQAPRSAELFDSFGLSQSLPNSGGGMGGAAHGYAYGHGYAAELAAREVAAEEERRRAAAAARRYSRDRLSHSMDWRDPSFQQQQQQQPQQHEPQQRHQPQYQEYAGDGRGRRSLSLSGEVELESSRGVAWRPSDSGRVGGSAGSGQKGQQQQSARSARQPHMLIDGLEVFGPESVI